MITPTQYYMFCMTHRTQIIQTAHSFLQQEHTLLDDERVRIKTFLEDYVAMVLQQKPNVTNEELTHALHIFMQTHKGLLSALHFNTCQGILIRSILRVLSFHQHKELEEMLIFQSKLLNSLTRYYFEEQAMKPVQHTYAAQLDAMSEVFIQHAGSEEIPTIVEKMQRIFHFKRCMFFAYHAWANEFYGVYGEELEKVQRLRGKLTAEHPVFHIKAPIYVEHPAVYIRQSVVDLFELSSVIFIPVRHGEELYGWLSFDQKGQHFTYDAEQLRMLETVGRRLALYFARKVPTNQLESVQYLTEKEKSVLHLLAEGYSNKEIAAVLFLSEFTVRDYVQQLLRKLQATNRTQLVTHAFRYGELR